MDTKEAGRKGALKTNKILTPEVRRRAAKKGWAKRRKRMKDALYKALYKYPTQNDDDILRVCVHCKKQRYMRTVIVGNYRQVRCIPKDHIAWVGPLKEEPIKQNV